MKNTLRAGLVMAGFVLAVTLKAQDADLWQQINTKYPGEPAVYIERSETLSILPKGDSLVVYSDVFDDILYLKEPTEMMASRRVHGSHFTEVQNLKAKTLVWEKSRHKELTVSNFARKFDTDDGIFHDDSYYYSVSFPAVAPRNRTQLEYRNNYRDPKFIPGFIFSRYLPQEKTVYTIKTTPDVDLMFEVLNDPERKIQFRKYERGKQVTYEWTAKGLEATKFDSNSPSLRYYAPHLVVTVKSFKTASGRKKVLSSLDDLYGWYYSFISHLRKDPPSADLVKIVEELKTPNDTRDDIVKKIYYWVQDNIRYIAFEEGMRGLIPHTGSYVCEKRYGDCKDMASLLVSMMDIAGITGYYTWIGTRDIPYAYTKYPTPIVDNHMIATYISEDGTYHFLDATSDHTPFGMPSSMIQGKEALIAKGEKDYEVKVVPVIPRELNGHRDSVHLAITDNELRGEGQIRLRGYSMVFAGYRLDRVREEDTRRYVTRLVGKGSNKFFLDEYSVRDMENRDRPTSIDYTFRIADYFQKIGDEIYINLNLNKDYYNDFINTTIRHTPVENEYRYVKEEIAVLDIPEGYTIDYMPPDVKHEGTLMGITVDYETVDKQIVMKKTFYVDYLLMNPSQFSEWNEAIARASEAYKESIILKKN
ncbi:MAG: transglutaminase-like domain-containing protein [Cyclobacteriaceae bacterium]|nr:transglutaminase-like domain-containing protein [Cyclobacteriaceae bacterium]